MPVKIRLMRIGAKKRPFYRVVAVDERKKRSGSYLELLGTYNPLTEPKEVILKQDKIDEWVKKGAQMSDGFLRITGKAPQKPPRKPKKSSVEAPKQKPDEAKPPANPPADEGTAKEEIPAPEAGVSEKQESAEPTQEEPKKE